MTIDSKSFRTIMSHYPTGVCVITAMTAEAEALGMTVGTFTSVSLDPPLIGFFPDKKSSSWSGICATRRFCVNVLAHDQEWLCRRFATRSSDKFAEVSYRHSQNGLPVLEGAVAWFDCVIHAVHEAGDHFLVLGKVEAMAIGRAASPLVFLQGQFRTVARMNEDLLDPAVG